MNRLTDNFVVPIEPTDELPEIGLASDLMTLTKARLSFLVVITTFVGFCMASSPQINWVMLLHAVVGTALAAASAAVLNQFMESHVDRLMERTRHRPLPAGRIQPGTALLLGVTLGLGGVAWLYLMTNVLSATLAAITVAIYLFLYTPLKRRTAWCTLVGALSGAIPPVIGWVAARGPGLHIGAGGWVLFGVLFAWQMPHFLAIAWMYRDEYAQAGFVMLKRRDSTGRATALISFLFTLLLGAVTIVPFGIGLNRTAYLIPALFLDFALLVFAGHFLIDRSRSTARRLFFASILFLPILLGVMVFTKT